MNTKEYVVNARNGDEHAIRQLMDSVSKKGKYIALEYVHDDAKAEDILQETFIKAFSSLDQLKDPDKFEPWFFTILNRLAINATNQKMIDKNSTNFSAYDSEDMNYEDSLTKDYVEFQPEENFDYSELKQGIQNIMEELPEAQRMAVYAYFFEGLNMREIPDLYDVGESTIRARINAAKTKMHDMIKSLEAKGMPLFGAAPASVFQWYANGECGHMITNVSSISSIQTQNNSKEKNDEEDKKNGNKKSSVIVQSQQTDKSVIDKRINKKVFIFWIIILIIIGFLIYVTGQRKPSLIGFEKGPLMIHKISEPKKEKEKDKEKKPDALAGDFSTENDLSYDNGSYTEEGYVTEEVPIYDDVAVYPNQSASANAQVEEADQACVNGPMVNGDSAPGAVLCY